MYNLPKQNSAQQFNPSVYRPSTSQLLNIIKCISGLLIFCSSIRFDKVFCHLDVIFLKNVLLLVYDRDVLRDKQLTPLIFLPAVNRSEKTLTDEMDALFMYRAFYTEFLFS